MNLLKKLALCFGITIMLPMVVYYGVDTITPAPKDADYSNEDYYNLMQHGTDEQKKEAKAKRDKLQNEQTEKRRQFEKRLFFVTVPIGIAAIILGAFLAWPAIGTGLLLGGLICVTSGYVTYWDELPSVYRFISLLLALAVLLFVGFAKIEAPKK